jgi:hypothetical protein
MTRVRNTDEVSDADKVTIDWPHRYLASAVEAGRIVSSLRCGPTATEPSDTSHLERTR